MEHDDHGAPKTPTAKKPWPVYVILGVVIFGIIWGMIHKYSGPKENTKNNQKENLPTEQTAPDTTKTYEITVTAGDWVKVSSSNPNYSFQFSGDGEKYFYKNNCGNEPMLMGDGQNHQMIPCSAGYFKAIDHDITILYWYIKN